jgi:Domain of unknown function (DUF4268)
VQAYEIDKIRRVPLREVWRHEALDFTTWLERNPDVLNDVVDLKIESVERERAAGTFSVDLVGEDQSGDVVVIENQLEKSNHDHLGKLVTYVSALEARTAIWIVSDPRPEHIGAITWLNESGAAGFYLLKVEAIQIGESPAAPLLTLITGPSDETREVGVRKQERAESHDSREAFWSSLLDRAKLRTRLHSGVSATTDPWLRAGSGRSGIHWTYAIQKRNAGVQLVIEGPDAGQNHALFGALERERDEIEKAFGDSLDWDRIEGRKRCTIGKALPGGYQEDRERWPEIQDDMVEAMIRLEAAIKPQLERVSL